MSEKPRKFEPDWTDPDDAPEWTEAMLDRAELSEAGRVLRPAGGTLTRNRERSPSDGTKRQVTLRLSARVVEHFRSTGSGWQSRIDDALLKMIDN